MPRRTAKTTNVSCPSCGGEFESTFAYCPYCGAMYAPAAEEEYMEHLDKIKDDMSLVDDVAFETENSAEIKKKSKTTVVFIVIILLVIGGLVLSTVIVNKYHDSRYTATAEEAYNDRTVVGPKMDALYAAGDYDELLRVYHNELSGKYSEWQWEHTDFVRMYEFLCESEKEMMVCGDDLSEEYVPSNLMYAEGEVVLYLLNGKLTTKEDELIGDRMRVVADDFNKKFPMTEEEKEKIFVGDYASFSEINNYCKEHFGHV